MFKTLSTYICWKKYIKCNIWRVPLRPSYIEDAGFLKVKYSCSFAVGGQPAMLEQFYVSANTLQTEEILPYNPAITITNRRHKFQQRS
jgi:hypothetical protein